MSCNSTGGGSSRANGGGGASAASEQAQAQANGSGWHSPDIAQQYANAISAVSNYTGHNYTEQQLDTFLDSTAPSLVQTVIDNATSTLNVLMNSGTFSGPAFDSAFDQQQAYTAIRALMIAAGKWS